MATNHKSIDKPIRQRGLRVRSPRILPRLASPWWAFLCFYLRFYKFWLEIQMTEQFDRKLSLKIDAVIKRIDDVESRS